MPFSDSNSLPDAKERFYQLPAVADPVKQAARTGRGHYNAATGRTLYDQSAMPMGEHLGKDMERVPAKYYLWLLKRPWFATATNGWEHVRDYIDRHLHEIEARAEKEKDTPTFNPTSASSPLPISASSLPPMPIPSAEPPRLPWHLEDGKSFGMALHRDLGFTCGPFSILAATGIDFNDLVPVLQGLTKPYRGYMNPTQMSETLRKLNVSTNLMQKPTHELIAGTHWRHCIARVQWENPGPSSLSPSPPLRVSASSPYAGWRNITEAYKHTHYIAHHDGWILCTATDPNQWLTATAWADRLHTSATPWHLTHRWFVKARK
jgi:hypothetical protein